MLYGLIGAHLFLGFSMKTSGRSIRQQSARLGGGILIFFALILTWAGAEVLMEDVKLWRGTIKMNTIVYNQMK